MGEMIQGQAPAQDPQYVHTGFTGMNPPTYYGGYDQQTGYDQTAYSQTGYNNTSHSLTALKNARALSQEACQEQ